MQLAAATCYVNNKEEVLLQPLRCHPMHPERSPWPPRMEVEKSFYSLIIFFLSQATGRSLVVAATETEEKTVTEREMLICRLRLDTSVKC